MVRPMIGFSTGFGELKAAGAEEVWTVWEANQGAYMAVAELEIFAELETQVSGVIAFLRDLRCHGACGGADQRCQSAISQG